MSFRMSRAAAFGISADFAAKFRNRRNAGTERMIHVSGYDHRGFLVNRQV